MQLAAHGSRFRSLTIIVEKRTLGNSDLSITRLGLGAWAIGGGDWKFGWGPQDDAQSVEAIRRAIGHGVN